MLSLKPYDTFKQTQINLGIINQKASIHDHNFSVQTTRSMNFLDIFFKTISLSLSLHKILDFTIYSLSNSKYLQQF